MLAGRGTAFSGDAQTRADRKAAKEIWIGAHSVMRAKHAELEEKAKG